MLGLDALGREADPLQREKGMGFQPYLWVERQVSMSCYGDKPPDFLALQPNGQIPVAVIDGTVLRSSDSIIERVLQMPGASPAVDEQLDPFDHRESTTLGQRFRSIRS